MDAPDTLHPDLTPADLRAWWMPFTHNRHFKGHPRLIESGKGAWYTLAGGQRVFDGLSGLWCSPLGHSPDAVVAAVQKQVQTLDYSPSLPDGPPGGVLARRAHRASSPAGRTIACSSSIPDRRRSTPR